jgi:5-methylcytosine-specific restriction endonuclease McrA
MKMGKCEITGWHLTASDVHCHHFKPLCLGGNNTFQNLRILHQDIHRLIHLSDISKIRILMSKLNINQAILVKINQYPKVCEQEAIVQN